MQIVNMKPMHNRRGFTKTIAMGVVILIIMAYGIYYAMQSPYGYPDEKYRTHHPTGFSIITPADWLVVASPANPAKNTLDTIYSIPKKVNGIPGFFSVTRLDHPPDLDKLLADGYEKSEKLGFSAYRKLWNGTNLRHLVYNFEKDGVWYCIELSRSLTEPVDKWWEPYIKSFKVDAPRPVLIGPSTNP